MPDEDWPGDGPNIWGLLGRGLLTALVLWLIYHLATGRGRADFEVRVRRGQVQCRGRLPRSFAQPLSEFLVGDLGIADARVMGARRGERLHLWYRGKLTQGQKQRIRNFFLTRL